MTASSEPVIGAWWAMCCIEDLYQIETEEDLADVRETIADFAEDFGGMVVRLWPTREAALAELIPEAGGRVSDITAQRLGLTS